MIARTTDFQPWVLRLLVWTGVIGLTAVVTLVSVVASVQVALVVVGLIVALILFSRTRIIVLAVLLVPTLSLVRRIAAGPSGYTASDPLILLPTLLVIVVVALSLTRPSTNDRGSVLRTLAVFTALGVATTVVLRGAFNVDGLFFASLVIVPMLLAVVLSSGRMPPVWDAVRRVLPGVAVFAGTYGIYQFVALPEWDRAWMRTSQLTSIGQALPFQVRVFAASESPGPFALFLGLVLTVCLAAAVTEAKGNRRLGWTALSAFLAYPLLLTGVRSALLGVAVSAVVLTLLRARGFSRVVIVAFLVGAYYLLTAVVARFGSNSTILTADRYTEFSADDDSLVARLALLQGIGNPFAHLVGNPNGGGADNLYVDTLLRYGLVPAAALLMFAIGITVVAIRNLARKMAETASLSIVFIMTMSLFGPTFNSLFGVLAGVVFGTVMAASNTGTTMQTTRRGKLAETMTTVSTR